MGVEHRPAIITSYSTSNSGSSREFSEGIHVADHRERFDNLVYVLCIAPRGAQADAQER